jgi:peptidoglycan/xylan/chitin deacetylase (PgdA/CDA1 family)
MPAPMHIVSLSFDDGFKKSSEATADLFERAGLRACINVLAGRFNPGDTAPAPVFKECDIPFGDFDLWNDLVARGHEVMPHGYRHANKSKLSFEDAQASILQCLDVFDAELRGFDRRRAIFNFPYNATTPQLEAWLPTIVRASRGGGIAHGINPIPNRETTVIRTCGFGPPNCENHLDQCLAELLKLERGWLVYNTHGLDAEGWGPIGTDYLRRLLDRLVAIPSVRVWPVGKAFTELGVMD